MHIASGSFNPGTSEFPAAARLNSPKSCCRELQRRQQEADRSRTSGAIVLGGRMLGAEIVSERLGLFDR